MAGQSGATSSGSQTQSGTQSQSGDQTQVTEPWAPQIPYLTAGFDKARQLFLDAPPPSFYPNSVTSPFRPEKETALQLQTMRATQGSPLQPLSNMQTASTLMGGYLPSRNPFATTLNEDFNASSDSPRFNDAVDAATRRVLPQVDSAFERAGRFNSGLSDTARQQAISDSYAGMYGQDKALTAQDRGMMGQNYSNERENIMRSLLIAPQVMSGDYEDFAKLGEVGDIRQGLDQQVLQEDIDRYNYAQNIMQQQIQQYMPLVQGNYGGTTTSNFNSTGSTNSTTNSNMQSQQQGGGIGKAIGGAMGGYNLASGISGFNPYLGAGLGLLGGLF